MIDLNSTKLGDCCYILVTFQAKPLIGEVIKILEKEQALEVTTSFGTRISVVQNTYWTEKEAKKNKFVKLDNNYKQWIKEMLKDEKAETDDRVDQIHYRDQEVNKDSGPDAICTSLSASIESKQKTVRKPTKKERSIKKNRRPSRSKK